MAKRMKKLQTAKEERGFKNWDAVSKRVKLYYN